MRPFGFIRLYREDVTFLHRLYYRLAGVAVDNKLHFLYLKRFLRRYLDRPIAGSILDAGCEYGDYSFHFADRHPGCEVLGIDIVGDCIDQNNRLLPRTGLDNLRFEQADIRELEYRDRFGFICCIDVLEHIPDQERAIGNLHRALKDDGAMFVHIPLARQKPVVFDRYLTDFHDWAEHEHTAEEHTRESIEALMRERGFRIVASESTFHHYLGELAVSIIMLFYGDTAFNRAVLALLTPLLWVLARLDVAIPFEDGNAVALLLEKEPGRRPPRRSAPGREQRLQGGDAPGQEEHRAQDQEVGKETDPSGLEEPIDGHHRGDRQQQRQDDPAVE